MNRFKQRFSDIGEIIRWQRAIALACLMVTICFVPLACDKKETGGYWINLKSGVRHNSSCRWYGNTKEGRYTVKSNGRSCKQCVGL